MTEENQEIQENQENSSGCARFLLWMVAIGAALIFVGLLLGEIFRFGDVLFYIGIVLEGLSLFIFIFLILLGSK